MNDFTKNYARKRMIGSSKRRTLWAAVVVAITAGGLTPTPGHATSWTVGDPIVTYWGAAWNPRLTDAVAQQLADGGFNLVWVDNTDGVAAAQRHGLRFMLQSPYLTPAALDDPKKLALLDAQIDQFSQYPGMYSYFVRDEPEASEFPALGRLVAHIRKRDPSHLCYINLVNYWASGSNNGASSYQDYLDQYVSNVHPSMLSYDNYNFQMWQGNKLDLSTYLPNLTTISQTAKRAGIPFMNITQACAWYTKTWRVPNANELRFLNYTTLAYGAQGISHFNYWPSSPNTGGLQPNPDGTPTQVFKDLTPLNKEFKNIAKQYQSLNAIGAYLKGYRAGVMPPGTTQLPSNSPFDITSVYNTRSYIDSAPVEGVLFGFFDKDGTTLADATFALVVNLDYSTSEIYTVTGPGNLSIFDATTGVWTPTGHSYATLNLAPGGGMLVGLTSVVLESSTSRPPGNRLGGSAVLRPLAEIGGCPL